MKHENYTGKIKDYINGIEQDLANVTANEGHDLVKDSLGKLVQITDFPVGPAIMNESIKSTGRAYFGTLYWFQIIGNAIIDLMTVYNPKLLWFDVVKACIHI